VWLALGALCVGLLFAAMHALTKIPHSDEGDLASTAISLLDAGRIAFPISYAYLPSIRHEYFLPPFYPSSLALWFEMFGRTIESYRLFHVAWLAVLVVAWTASVRAAAGVAVAMPIAALLLALNYDLINLSVSRSDVVCASLNATAIGLYATLRLNRFGLAVFLSNCFLAFSAITHPNALFGLVGCGAIFVAGRDWQRIRARHLALALLPYTMTFGAWATIIDGRWELFTSQMRTMSTGKGLSSGSVIADDFVVRWWQLFAGWREGVPSMMRLKTGFLALWLVVPFLAVRRGMPGTFAVRAGLTAYALASVILLALTDAFHYQVYSIHAIGAFTALTAIVASDLYHTRPRWATPVTVMVFGIAAFGAGAIGLRVKSGELQREFKPMASYVRAESVKSGLVVGPGELGFVLGFADPVRTDPALSSIGSSEMPLLIVSSLDLGHNVVSDNVGCKIGERIQDSTAYVEVDLATPRKYYRVFRRSDESSSEARGQTNVRIFTRNCP